MVMRDTNDLAAVVEQAFSNPDMDENIVDAVNRLARAITNLGNADAATPMGGMEALGKSMTDAADRIASAIERLADAVESAAP